MASLVVFANDLTATAGFYRAAGVPLEDEDHGDGPIHSAADIDGVHFAVYQADSGLGSRAGQLRSAGSTFPGLFLVDLDAATSALSATGATILEPHQQRPWGCRIIAADPDGRAIEINQPHHC